MVTVVNLYKAIQQLYASVSPLETLSCLQSQPASSSSSMLSLVYPFQSFT